MVSPVSLHHKVLIPCCKVTYHISDFHGRVLAMCSDQLMEEQAGQGTQTQASIKSAVVSTIKA